jgi:uncharacterized membrane protein YhhN
VKRISFLISCAYALLAFGDILFSFTGVSSWRYITKPLLMPVLMLVLWLESGGSNMFTKLVFLALACSWAGDISLMFTGYFIYGLAFFLIAHIFYLVSILQIKGQKGILQFQPLFALPIVVYLVLLLSLLSGFLDKLKTPVFVYSIVICSFWTASMNLFWKTDRKTASLFFFGSLQFVLSDSLLAVNRFVYPYSLLPGLVMATYCAAQFLLIRGAISYNKKRNFEIN